MMFTVFRSARTCSGWDDVVSDDLLMEQIYDDPAYWTEHAEGR